MADPSPSPPLVSIVLPTYDGARHLQASIDSCLAQTHENLELVIVDDGSPDPLTGEILDRQQDGRVRVARLGRNVGLPRALNEGFRLARGELLTWTSDDNLYRPRALETMAREIERAGADFVYARAAIVNEEGREVGAIVPRPPAYLPLDNCVGACFLYTRRVLESVGEYDPDMTLTEDYDYWIRVSKRFRMVPIDEDLYCYRHHPTTLTSRHGRSRVQEMIDKARFRHFGKARILAAEGLRAYDRGDRARARGLFLSALARRPWALDVYCPAAICALPRPLVRAVVALKKMFR